jgi:hypothetical protein
MIKFFSFSSPGDQNSVSSSPERSEEVYEKLIIANVLSKTLSWYL